MSLITLVVVLIIVGVLLWLVNTSMPMEATIKRVLNVVVVLVVCLWLLQQFGLIGSVGNVHLK